MLKRIIAVAAVIAIATSGLVYAQQQRRGQRVINPDRFAATQNARIATLKAGLELTPDQSQNWAAYQQALQNWVQMRVARLQARAARQAQAGSQPAQAGSQPAQPRRGNLFSRLSRRADNMNKTSAALKAIADAGTPLYASLSSAQKARFRLLTRALMPQLMATRRQGQQGRRNRRG